VHDLIVVGAGPVGLHAALKAAVLNHSVLLVDKGRAYSRVSQAPTIANLPFAPGISGLALLDALRRDLARFASIKGEALVDVLEDTEALSARRDAEGFVVSLRSAEGAPREERGRVLILATGVVDRKPGIDRYHAEGHGVLAPYVRGDEIGYCVLCEGWRLEGREVAVVGESVAAAQVARDLAGHFRARVTLLTDGARAPPGIPAREERIASFADEKGRLRVAFAEGEPLLVDQALFHLGWYKANNELAVALGAAVDAEGLVKTTPSCECVDRDGNVLPGLYAVGDLRAGSWKQIVVGWGDAETAVISAYAYRLP